MARFAAAFGRPVLWPYWATGFWQSKNRYRNGSQLVQVAARYRDLGLPLAAVAIDYYSWAPLPPGDEDFGDPACWPAPGETVARLRAMGVEVLLSPYLNYVRPPTSQANASANWPAAVGHVALKTLVGEAEGSECGSQDAVPEVDATDINGDSGRSHATASRTHLNAGSP